MRGWQSSTKGSVVSKRFNQDYFKQYLETCVNRGNTGIRAASNAYLSAILTPQLISRSSKRKKRGRQHLFGGLERPFMEGALRQGGGVMNRKICGTNIVSGETRFH